MKKIMQNYARAKPDIMVIYEVNLTIEASIYDEYFLWLKQHLKEMLLFDGFKQAEIDLIIEESGQYKKLRVAYYVESEKHLDDYLSKHAAEMRQDAICKFGEKFSATRRVYTPIFTIAGRETHHPDCLQQV